MNVARKYIKPLSNREEETLLEIMKHSNNERERMRAHCILLSNKEYSIDEIANIYDKHRNTISELIDKWEKEKYKALVDNPRSGRPAILNEEEQNEVKKNFRRAKKYK